MQINLIISLPGIKKKVQFSFILSIASQINIICDTFLNKANNLFDENIFYCEES